MDRDEAKGHFMARLIIVSPFILLALWLLYYSSIEQPLRERQQAQWHEEFRAESQRRADETPMKIDVRGMTPEALKEKYGVEDGRTKIKEVQYVLIDGHLWAVTDGW